MRIFLQALNRPVDAFKANSKCVAFTLVALTILINAVFEPILRMLAGNFHKGIDVVNILRTAAWGVCTYSTICLAFWIVSKCFGSKTALGTYIRTWGITYFPTALCSLVVAFTEVYFHLFWNSVIWGMVFNILFVGILLWKTILYLLYLREVAGLAKGKLAGAFIVTAACIALLTMANGYVGLKTPVL